MVTEQRLIDAEPICEKCGLRGYYNCHLCEVGTAPTVVQRWTEKGETMEVKKRLVEILLQADIADNISENADQHREFVADFMIANGATISPAVPGPDGDDHNIMELCFRNGEQHIKEKIIARMMEHKTQVKGVYHAHVVEIIKMVECL